MLNYEKIDVRAVLDHYSIKNIREYGTEINFSCPFPEHYRGDRNPSAYINKESGKWHCFSCFRKGNLVTFISQIEEIPIAVAIRWLRESYGGGFNHDPLMPLLDKAIQEKRMENEIILPLGILKSFRVDWNRVKNAENSPKILSNILLRLTPQILQEHDIGYDQHTNRITFPIFNEDGKLVGIKGRAARRDQKPRYLSIGDRNGSVFYGFKICKTHEYVWGLDTAKNYEPKIVVEGEIDAMKMRTIGHKGAVALGGSNPSKSQINSLKRNAETVILMLDPDEAGKKAEQILAQALTLFLPTKIARLDRTDPADSTNNEIDKALRHTINILNIKE